MDMDMDTSPDELLVTRRSRRSTAGNRMEAAMAEMELDQSRDAEDDADFTNDKDEEDIFDEDFESTDDEAQNDDAAAEAAALEEEKRARKAKRRVALGGAVNAATGEAIVARGGGQRPIAHRQSMRKHTVLNTSLTETRLKRSEERKAAQPNKKPRAQGPTVSQAELIARALDAEEGNIVEHRDYLKLEEEKRRRARVVRPTVEGPLLRWVSRMEEVKVVVPPAPPPTYGYGYAAGSSGGYVFPAYQPATGTPNLSTFNTPLSNNPPASHASIPSNGVPSNLAYLPNPAVPYVPYTPPAPTTRIEKVARNYVVHEEVQHPEIPMSNTTVGRSAHNRSQSAVPKPTWGATMTAMFGSHVNWEEVKVYTGKGRLMGRPTQICPLTGGIARYRDPRTGVPFADVGAFETLTRVLNHEYVWSPDIGAYTRQEAPVAKEE
ncbi:hypothetical protein B0H11DRAFT_2002386 [Mycena galericulata]|nr:hypothetical protein B0H11DRAFT_2002386 [Mycena galericulata]